MPWVCLSMLLPRDSVPGVPTRGCAPARNDQSADREQFRMIIFFLSSQTCLTNALQTPAIRRGPKSAKTSWATSTASAKLAGRDGSVTKVRPVQPWDRVEGVGIGTTPAGLPKGTPGLEWLCLPSLFYLSLPQPCPCLTWGHSHTGPLWLRQECGSMTVPTRIQGPQ